MGFGKFLKGVAGGVGDVAKFAAPALTFIPGVGPVAAGLVGAAGGALGTLNDRDEEGNERQFNFGRALKHAAGHGVGSYGAARFAEAPKQFATDLGGMAGRVGDFFSDKDKGMNRLAMAGMGLGAASNMYGARQMGRAEDQMMGDRRDDQLWARKRAEMNDPMRQKMMETFLNRLGG